MLVAYFVILFFMIVLAFLPIVYNRKKVENYTFCLATICIGGWVLSNYFLVTTAYFLFWNRLAYSFATMVGVLLLHFVLQYPKNIIKLNLIKIFSLYFFPIIISFLAMTPFIVKSMESATQAEFGRGQLIWTIYFAIYMITTFTIIIKGIRKYKGLDKTRLQYFLTGLVTFIVLALITNNFLPAFGMAQFYAIGPLFSSIFIFLTVFSMIKHELMDIKAVITRFGSYIILITLMVFSFSILNMLIAPVENMNFTIFSNSLLCLLWAVIGNKIREKFQTYTERKWITDWYDPTEIVNDLSIQLSNIFTRKEIITSSLEIINQYIPTKNSKFFVADIDLNGNIKEYKLLSPKDNLLQSVNTENEAIKYFSKQKNPIQFFLLSDELKNYFEDIGVSKGFIFLPLRSQNALEGVIVLGKRTSELSYTEKDIKLFITIIDIISVYLERLLPYEKIKKEYSKTLEAAEKMSYQAALSSLNLGITHEINNPLAIIKTDTELMFDLLGKKTISVTNGLFENVLKKYNLKADELIEELIELNSIDNNGVFTDNFIVTYYEKNIELNPKYDEAKEEIQSILFDTYIRYSIHSYFSNVNRSVDRILQITDTMLRHGKAETEEKEVVDIRSILSDFKTIYESTSKKYRVDLKIDLGNDEMLVLCDKVRMSQIFLNLAKNSIQAMENNPNDKSRLLNISLSKKSFINKNDQKVDGIEIIFRDTGIGILEENIKKIFDPFFTVGKQKSGGANTGLGLSIVLKIIEDHGGIVTVESTIGEGSTFKMYLPLQNS